MRWRVAAVTVLALAGITAAPARADIYGTNIRWASTTIPVKVHVHDVRTRVVKQGVNYWTVTNLTPRIGGGTCMAGGVPDGCVDIGDGAHFADSTWVAAAERFSIPDGTIVGCWIRYSGDKYWGAGSSLRPMVDDAAAHEFGHCVGHAHTSDPAIPSVMQPALKNWNGLQPYDVSEDLRLYPFPVRSAGAGNGNHSNLTVERFVIKVG